jgi:hypothetical protein
VPLNIMMDHIDRMERHYNDFVEQADEIAGGMDYSQHADFKRYWEKWREYDTLLKTTYDATIKQDPRFHKLFRPGRKSRWGDIVPSS